VASCSALCLDADYARSVATAPDPGEPEPLLAPLDEAQRVLLNVVGESTVASRHAPMFHHVEDELEARGFDAMATIRSLPRIPSGVPHGVRYSALRYDTMSHHLPDEAPVNLTIVGMAHLPAFWLALQMFFAILEALNAYRLRTPHSANERPRFEIPETVLAQSIGAEAQRWWPYLGDMLAGEPGLWRVQRLIPQDDEGNPLEPLWKFGREIRTFSGVQSMADYLSRVRRVIGSPASAIAASDALEALGRQPRNWSPRVPPMAASGAPQLNGLHPLVREAAQSLWVSGHCREAVLAAASRINAHTQERVQRRDVSDDKLMQECFSDRDPDVGKPRLRLPGEKGDQTRLSRQRGLLQLALACSFLIRNPAAHSGEELRETEALEQLATLSLLARTLAECELVQLEG
jgi:Protein of unknown function (Hypoth_ymh)